MSLRLTGKNTESFERPCRVAYSILIGNKARRTASGSPSLLPAACGRGLAESSSPGSGALSRRNSSMRARITAKSSAARGHVMSPPFSFFGVALWAVPLYRCRAELGTRNSRSFTVFCRAISEAGGGSARSAATRGSAEGGRKPCHPRPRRREVEDPGEDRAVRAVRSRQIAHAHQEFADDLSAGEAEGLAE